MDLYHSKCTGSKIFVRFVLSQKKDHKKKGTFWHIKIILNITFRLFEVQMVVNVTFYAFSYIPTLGEERLSLGRAEECACRGPVLVLILYSNLPTVSPSSKVYVVSRHTIV